MKLNVSRITNHGKHKKTMAKKNANFYFMIHNSSQGYIALSMVIVIVAVVIALSVTVSLLSIGEAQSALTLTQGEGTLSFVEGCTEDALLKAKSNSGYTGGNITRPEGTCSVAVSKVSNIWTLTISTTAINYARTIQVIVNRDGYGENIVSWLEI